MNRRGNFKRKSKIIRGKATQLQNIKEKRKNKVNIQENERTNNKKICKYFLQGKCTFQNCQFLHIHPQNVKKNKINNDKTINNGNSTQIINNTNDNLDSSKEDVNNEDLDDLNNKKVEEDKEEEGEIKEKDDSEHEEEHDDEEKLEEEKENIENNEINEEEKELSEEIETTKEIETAKEIVTTEIDETPQIKEKDIIVTCDKSIQTDEINDGWGSTFGLSISFAVPKYSFSNPSIPNSWNLSNGAPLFGKPTSQNKEEQKKPNVYNDILPRKSIIISF